MYSSFTFKVINESAAAVYITGIKKFISQKIILKIKLKIDDLWSLMSFNKPIKKIKIL